MHPSLPIDHAWMPLAPAAMIAFTLLTVAVATLWWPRILVTRFPLRVWSIAFVASVLAAVAGRLVEWPGLLMLVTFALACHFANRVEARVVRSAIHVTVLLLAAGLLMHVLPGFNNPRALTEVVLTPDAAPYTKYLSFDKGAAGVLLLGLYVPARPLQDHLAQRWRGWLWRFLGLVVVVMAATLALGFARWDPKLPAWWPQWIWSMAVLTAMPEEAIFRGVAQHWVANRLGGGRQASLGAAVIAGTVFGIAHLAGGWGYVALATIAGIGYGWIYASTGSLAASIAAHAGLNTLHFLLFTYPALAAAQR